LDYAQITKNTHELIKRFGLSVKLTRAGSNVGYAVGVFDQTKKQNETSTSSAYRAQSTATERMLYLSGLMKAPAVGDIVNADKDTWTVIEIEVVRPSTTTVLYILKVS